MRRHPRWHRLNIRANCEPLLVGAVRFQLTGNGPSGEPLSLPRSAINGFPNPIEIFYPHLLAGDPSIEGEPLPNHSNPWTPQPGHYRLVGTPYADRKSSGMRGQSLTVNFDVTQRAPNSFSRLRAAEGRGLNCRATRRARWRALLDGLMPPPCSMA
jgi:hypothetical protein